MFNWEGKRVLITGAYGFVGANLTKTLLKKKAVIIALSRRSSKKNRSRINKNLIHRKGLIEDFSSVNSVIKNNDIDIIFHLAAQSLVEIGRQSPLKTFETNIQGVWNILESARQNKVKKIIVASTTHVYGDNPNVPYSEEYYPQPSRPYETSKACADLIAQSFADTYNLPVEIPRFSNIYGPGDINFSRIVPRVIKSVMNNVHPMIWDTGAVRDFIYIKDAINAYMLIAEKDLPKKKRVRVFNIGSGKPINIIELVYRIISFSENPFLKINLQKVPKDRKKEIPQQFISIEKAKDILGWSPKISLNTGLRRSINWYRKYFQAR